MNNFRTFFLLLALTALMLFIGELLGGRSGLVMGLGFALVSNLLVYFFSDKIVLAMYGAKPIGPGDYPQVHRIVQELAQKASMPMPRLYYIPNRMANAFATGRNPQHAALAVTQGILDILDERELRGVLAHELSHVLHRDILISTIAAIIAGAVYTLARIAQWGLWFGSGHRDNERGGGHPLALLFIAIIAPLAATIIQLAVSRSREYEADRGGADLSEDPLALADALTKIHQAAAVAPGFANPVTAHLFIVNPLKGENFMALFSTHPPLSKRVERLESMAQRMGHQTSRSAQYNIPKIIY